MRTAPSSFRSSCRSFSSNLISHVAEHAYQLADPAACSGDSAARPRNSFSPTSPDLCTRLPRRPRGPATHPEGVGHPPFARYVHARSRFASRAPSRQACQVEALDRFWATDLARRSRRFSPRRPYDVERSARCDPADAALPNTGHGSEIPAFASLTFDSTRPCSPPRQGAQGTRFRSGRARAASCVARTTGTGSAAHVCPSRRHSAEFLGVQQGQVDVRASPRNLVATHVPARRQASPRPHGDRALLGHEDPPPGSLGRICDEEGGPARLRRPCKTRRSSLRIVLPTACDYADLRGRESPPIVQTCNALRDEVGITRTSA